jgi:hypothetical protein
MRKQLALTFCLFLAGCTDGDWDRALNYVYPAPDDADATSAQFQPQSASDADTASIPSAPVTATSAASTASIPNTAAQPANADFCRAVATQDASGSGFDPATQQRVFARSYGQCVAIYAR